MEASNENHQVSYVVRVPSVLLVVDFPVGVAACWAIFRGISAAFTYLYVLFSLYSIKYHQPMWLLCNETKS